MVRTSIFVLRRAADAASSSCCFRALIASLQPISPSASAIWNPMPRDPPVTSATFPPRSNSLFACMVAPFLDRVHLADGRSVVRPAPTGPRPVWRAGGEALESEIAEALRDVQLELTSLTEAAYGQRAQFQRGGAKSFSQSACLQVRDPATEVELELAGGPKAAFTGFGHLLECCRRPQEPAEGRLRRLKLGLVGQAALIEDRLGGIQRLAIE